MAVRDALCFLFVLLAPVLGGTIPEQRGIEFGPRNIAEMLGSTVTLTCQTDGVANANIRWYEFATDPNGAMISDGSLLLPSHPNYARYQLDQPDYRTTNLIISNIVLEDGGYYQCRDSNAAPPSTVQRGAELIVIAAAPNCTRSYPANGFTIEGQYHTAECTMYYRASAGIFPLMTWTGPQPFQTGSLATNISVWSGISFNVERSMDAQNWLCTTNFTSAGFGGPDSDNIPPSWSHVSPTNQVFVYWPPSNMTAIPIQASYEIGQTIKCWADAFPDALYVWQSLRTSEFWYSDEFSTRADMVGYQLMRCTAKNTLDGYDYSRDFFLDVYVNAPATTVQTTTPSTTTPPPAWSDCPDITGRWEAVNPNASVCITVDHANNAQLIGLYRNGSDTFWLQLTGKTREGKYSELGWAVIWPSTSIGVSSYAVECHTCHGVDTLMANGISRTSKDTAFCAEGGTVTSSPRFTFYRAPISWPCSSSPAVMQRNIEQAELGLLHE